MPPKKAAPAQPAVLTGASEVGESEVQPEKKAIADFGTQMQEENKRLKTEVQELSEQLQNLQKDTDDTITSQNERINELEAEKSRYESEIQDLEKEIIASKGAAQQALDERKALKVEADNKLLDRVKEREEELDQCKIQNQELELEISRLREENEGIHEEIQDLAENFEEKEAELEALQKDYDDLEAKFVAPSSSFKHLPTIDYSGKTGQLEETAEPDEDPEVVEAAQAPEASESLNAEMNERLRTMIEEGKALIERQEEQLSEKNGQISILQEQVEHLNTEMAGSAAELEKLTDENGTLKYQLEELDAQLKVLQMDGDSIKNSHLSVENVSEAQAEQASIASGVQQSRGGLKPNELITEHTLSIPGAQTLEQVNYNELRSKINNLNEEIRELEGFKKRFIDLQADYRVMRAELNTKSIECKRLQNQMQNGTMEDTTGREHLEEIDAKIGQAGAQLLVGLDTQPKFKKLQEERKMQRSNPSILEEDDVQDLKDDLLEAEKEIRELKEENAFLLNANEQYEEEIRLFGASAQKYQQPTQNEQIADANAQNPKTKLFEIEVKDFAVQVAIGSSVEINGCNVPCVNEFVETEQVFPVPIEQKLAEPKRLQDENGLDFCEIEPDVFDVSSTADAPQRLRLLGNQIVDNATFQRVNFNGYLHRNGQKYSVLNGTVELEPCLQLEEAEQHSLSPREELETYKAECDRLQTENDSYRRQLAQLQPLLAKPIYADATTSEDFCQTETTAATLSPTEYAYENYYPVLPCQFEECPMQPPQLVQPTPKCWNVAQATSPTIPDIHDYQPPAVSCQTEQYFVSAEKFQELREKYKAAMDELTRVQISNVQYGQYAGQYEQKKQELKAALDHIRYVNDQNQALQREITILQENLNQAGSSAVPVCEEAIAIQSSSLKGALLSLQTRLEQKQTEVDNLQRLLELERTEATERIEFLQNQVLQLNKVKDAAEDMQLQHLKTDLLALTQTGENEIIRAEGTSRVKGLELAQNDLESENHTLRKEVSRISKAAKLVKREYEDNFAELSRSERDVVSMRSALLSLCAQNGYEDVASFLRQGDTDNALACLRGRLDGEE